MGGYIIVICLVAGGLIGLVIALIFMLNRRSDNYDQVMKKISDMSHQVLRRKGVRHSEGEEAHRVREAELEFVLELLSDIK